MQDINQLKLILETIGQTTESAKWVLLAWLGIDILKIVIGWAGGIILLKLVITVLTNIFSMNCFGKQCRDAVIPGEQGTHVSDSERRKVMETIRLGLEAKK